MSVSAEAEEPRAIVKRRRIGVMSGGAVVVVVLAAVLLTSPRAQKSAVIVRPALDAHLVGRQPLQWRGCPRRVNGEGGA